MSKELDNALKSLLLRFFVSKGPTIYVNTDCEDVGKVFGVVSGLKKHKEFRVVTEDQIMSATDEAYQDWVQYTDLLLAFRTSPMSERKCYFPLDIKNSGGYIVEVADHEHDYYKLFDQYLVGKMPGFFPDMIRLLKSRGVHHVKEAKKRISKE